MKDQELFELCREVYEKTKWGQYGDEGLDYYDSRPVIPLYTSDYLLEKLPKFQHGLPLCVATSAIPFVDRPEWFAGYISVYANDKGSTGDYVYDGNTPLKALLKLTLKLIEDGVEL